MSGLGHHPASMRTTEASPARWDRPDHIQRIKTLMIRRYVAPVVSLLPMMITCPGCGRGRGSIEVEADHTLRSMCAMLADTKEFRRPCFSVADTATGREAADSHGMGRTCAETPQARRCEGGSGRINVSACWETA